MRLVETGAAISLREVALRCLVPGMPDIYQGGERALIQLTDPDNRRLPDWPWPAPAPGTLDARKQSLLKTLLQLRRDRPALFAEGAVAWERAQDGTARLVRFAGGERVEAAFLRTPPEPGAHWADWSDEAALGLAIHL
jgi:(1->4)-alpha-D-glucan 1-alpha-D-glucosylmutase